MNINGSANVRSGSSSSPPLSKDHQEEVSREYNAQDDAHTRNTRISFELHPSLILDDIFLGLYDPKVESIDMASDFDSLRC